MNPKIFMFAKLSYGMVFEFYDYDNNLSIGDVVDLWYEKDRGGLGEEIVYGHARVKRILAKGHYEAIVLY